MKVRNIIIAALLIVIGIMWATRKPPPSLDYSHKIDSLKTVVDNSYKRIAEEERAKLQKAAEITRLNRQISSVRDDQQKTISKYQKKIEGLERLKTPQIDSLLVTMYGDPLDSRQIVTDLIEGDQAQELLTLAKLEMKHLSGIVENQQGIIHSDSLHILELNKVVASIKEQGELRQTEIADLKADLKKKQRANRWLKAAIPVTFIIALFVPN